MVWGVLHMWPGSTITKTNACLMKKGAMKTCKETIILAKQNMVGQVSPALEKHLSSLKLKFESYAPISNASWLLIRDLVEFQTPKKGAILLRKGRISRKTYFICEGALRAYCSDENGKSYNKNLFLEHDFAGSKVSALQGTPSTFTVEALENSILISIDYKKYRELISANQDLKNFYIAYLERNWIIEKEQREVSLVLENATVRYRKFIGKHPGIDKRISLQHIASHLGITPTQLSRIRKDLKSSLNQHM